MKKQNMVRAKVVSITDGDTFKVLLRGQEETIRIACIDTPEMSEAPWGQRAKDALTGMLRVGSKVSLMEHDTDRYGRTIAEVYKGRGRNIGLALVKKGYAEVYDEYAYQCDEDKLTKFESKAKRQGKGMWRTTEEAIPVEVPVEVVETEEDATSSNVPAYTGSRRITCSQLSSQSQAREWLNQGHSYLDADSDGIPCESLPLY